jgi:hypothetical protein
MSSMQLRGVALVLELTGTGSLAAGNGEEYFEGEVGDDDKDWNSGEDAAMGALNGISMAMRRWRASFWAERSMYFCIDSFYMTMLVCVEGGSTSEELTRHKVGLDMGAMINSGVVLFGTRIVERRG